MMNETWDKEWQAFYSAKKTIWNEAYLNTKKIERNKVKRIEIGKRNLYCQQFCVKLFVIFKNLPALLLIVHRTQPSFIYKELPNHKQRLLNVTILPYQYENKEKNQQEID